ATGVQTCALPIFPGSVEHVPYANGVGKLEGPEIPTEPPSHDAVHVIGRVCNARRDARRVDERWRERLAEERPHTVLAVKQPLHPLATVLHGPCGLERAATRGLPRADL